MNEPFVPEVAKVDVAAVDRGITRITQVSLRDDAERADGGERAALVAVDLVGAVPFQDTLPLVPARQIEPVEKHVAGVIRVTVAFARSIPVEIPIMVVVEIALVVEVAAVCDGITPFVTVIAWVVVPRIEVEHSFLLRPTNGPTLSGWVLRRRYPREALCRDVTPDLGSQRPGRSL